MFNRLGLLVSRHPVAVIAAWIALAAGLHAVAPRWDDVTRDGDLAYLPAEMPSVVGEKLLASAFPERLAKSQLAVVVERPGQPFAPTDLAWIDSLAERLEDRAAELPIVEVWHRHTPVAGKKLLSKPTADGQAAIVLLQLANEFMAVDNVRVVADVRRLLDAARAEDDFPAGLAVGITGSAAVGGDMLTAAAESIRNTEWATIGLVTIILLGVYRAPVLVLIPLATIGLSLFVALDVLSLLTQLNRVPGFSWWDFQTFKTTKIFIVVILFGSGTDFCLFTIARFREEIERGLDRAAAIRTAVGRVGAAVLGSALTTILGLSTMYFAAFGKFRNSGPAIALCLAVTLVACLTLCPALVRACGPLVFWPFRPRTNRRGAVVNAQGLGRYGSAGERIRIDAALGGLEKIGTGTSQSAPAEWEDGSQLGASPIFSQPHGVTASPALPGFWGGVGRAVLARPGFILAASVLALAPLAVAGWQVPISYDFLSELSPSSPSVVGTNLARRHFPAGETSPITVLAVLPEADFSRLKGKRAIALLTRDLFGLEGIEGVRSLTSPAGEPPRKVQLFRLNGLADLASREHSTVKNHFATQVDGVGAVARFDLALSYDPFSPQAVELLWGIENFLAAQTHQSNSFWHGARFQVAGTTAGVRDLATVTASDNNLIQQLVVLTVLLVLIVILKRPVVCLYLIVTVLASYYVTIGATELFFAWLYGDAFVGLDWKVPIFLFVILIAVGEDYNIFLVTRVWEEQRRHGPRAGIERAVALTGGIITSCGVIMAGTFVSMTFGTLRAMQELGFALSLGVMLDTCIVRPVLVPAFLALIERQTPSQPARPLAERELAESASLAGTPS